MRSHRCLYREPARIDLVTESLNVSRLSTLHAAHVAETHSGHNIYLYQPGLVVDTIRKVVGKVRHLS
jgi:hypothetical protein